MSDDVARRFEQLERLGRIRLSQNFFLRDFLYSEIAIAYGIPNIPDDIALATDAGAQLCERILEPLQVRFGRLHIRSAFRSSAVNEVGNLNGHNCSRNEANYADHIWDRRDAQGNMGATACIVLPAFADRFDQSGDWTELAWWIHDHLPYASICFFPKRWAFNIQWRENPEPSIYSYAGWTVDGAPKRSGYLTKAGMPNFEGSHEADYTRLQVEFPE